MRGYVRQAWRDMLNIYYTNTPTWRWLKSGALVFLGFFLWMGGAVLLSVQEGWGFLTYVMAYGFLLLVWGPLTHLVVVPLTIRLRRSADHPAARWFSRNSGKVNLSIFFTLVIVFGTLTPPVMMLEFSPGDGGGDGVDVSGDLNCDTVGDPITCEMENPSGFDRLVVRSGGETIATAEEPPFAVEFEREQLEETRIGREFQVHLEDEDGEVLRRFVRQA